MNGRGVSTWYTAITCSLEEYINQSCGVMDRIRDVELGFRDLHDFSIPGPFPTSPNPFANQSERTECLRIQT